MDETEKLLGKADALLGKHRSTTGENTQDIPTLTDVVSTGGSAAAPAASTSRGETASVISSDALLQALQQVYLSIDEIIDTRLRGLIMSEAQAAATRVSAQLANALTLEIAETLKQQVREVVTEAVELELLRLEDADANPGLQR